MSCENQLIEPIVREVPVELNLPANGAIVPTKVKIRYVSPTVKQLREQQNLFNARRESGEMVYISEVLLTRVKSIVGEDGAEVEATIELLDQIDVANLRAIETAVDEDINPEKKLTSDSRQDG